MIQSVLAHATRLYEDATLLLAVCVGTFWQHVVQFPMCHRDVRSLTRTDPCMVSDYCVFFFQAEDGIRDYKVTGVQTCALPIYSPRAQFGHGTGSGCRTIPTTMSPIMKPLWGGALITRPSDSWPSTRRSRPGTADRKSVV